MYDRIIRIRGLEVFEPACKATTGYQLDPDYNRGYSLIIRGYLVAEDYSIDEFTSMVRTEAEKRSEVEHFRATFKLNIPSSTESAEISVDENEKSSEADKLSEDKEI